LDAARRAVELDPENVRGLQAQMTALFFKKDVEAALEVGAQALAINPNDTELVGEYGLRLALSGEWRRGGELMQSVLGRNADSLGYYETALALCFYMERDYKSAAAWIRKANVQANPLYHLVAAAIFGQSGDTTAAAIERQWLMEDAPQVVGEVDGEMSIRNVPPRRPGSLCRGSSQGWADHCRFLNRAVRQHKAERQISIASREQDAATPRSESAPRSTETTRYYVCPTCGTTKLQ
jgi:tetratricopeptide (TPR) repeat protein